VWVRMMIQKQQTLIISPFMAPEESVIEPSSLTKFRKLRLQNIGLLDLLINKTVEIALERPQ
jgi:hypothetical protein